MEKTKDSYIEENRGFITASKLKCFMNSPEDFFLKYVKEVEPLQEKEKKHFKIGTAIDDFISYGENEFHKKYFIDEGLKVADLKVKLEEMGVDVTGMKQDDLKEALYGDISSKVRLTAGEGKEVLGCVNELKRQTLFDAEGEYDCQKTFVGQYKNLKLKGTLDRRKKGMIRDTKSTSGINSFMWDWKDKLGYDVSMSFYWVLVWKATGDKDRIIFDVVQKTYPYPSRIFEMPQGEILEVVEQKIIPALDLLDQLMTLYNETQDESIWLVRQGDFSKLASCEMYPIMQTTIQQEVETLQ